MQASVETYLVLKYSKRHRFSFQKESHNTEHEYCHVPNSWTPLA